MSPRTLEHVLAHSMRFPRQRADQIIPSLFHSSHLPVVAPGSQMKATSTRTSYLYPRYLIDKIDEKSGRSVDRLSTYRLKGLSPPKLVRNGMDLLIFLKFGKKMGAWEESLATFLDATCTVLPDEVLVTSGGVRSSSLPSPPPASAPPDQRRKCHVTPSSAHITLLMDMCASSEQWGLTLFLVRHFGEAHPSIISHAVGLMARRRVAPIALREEVGVPKTTLHNHLGDQPSSQGTVATKNGVEVRGWQVACYYLTRQLCFQLHCVPVEAFNVILSSCRSDGDWIASMAVVRCMGPNPLQYWQSVREYAAISRHSDEVKETKSVLASDWFCPFSTPAQQQVPTESHMTLIPNRNVETSGAAATHRAASAECNAVESTFAAPSPDVVSYATLIVTLEQAGEFHLATEVLNRLPPLEKNKITASYVSLIGVWSSQVCNRKRW
ncbi:unnamed protein product [Phytomonas sp. EM1]|nr:unnamed protein product [Phytomonas sp. EM1]|eukprot:CCW61237.1 unnamed protein product [Phytomonas sp. isolate EM1]